MQDICGRTARFAALVIAAGALSVAVSGQDVKAAAASDRHPESPADEFKGMPPRAAPTDYQSVAKAGAITIGAEFTGHSIPTPDHTYSSDEYVVVEVGLFGAPDARTRLSIEDFSLRVNGRKAPVPAEPYERVRGTLKDPEWSPPKEEDKGKTSINTGGASQNTPAAPVHMPMELRLPMERRVHSAAMLQGDRPLPQAGLLFFLYRGKEAGIHTVELIYSGPAGKATLELNP